MAECSAKQLMAKQLIDLGDASPLFPTQLTIPIQLPTLQCLYDSFIISILLLFNSLIFPIPNF